MFYLNKLTPFKKKYLNETCTDKVVACLLSVKMKSGHKLCYFADQLLQFFY